MIKVCTMYVTDITKHSREQADPVRRRPDTRGRRISHGVGGVRVHKLKLQSSKSEQHLANECSGISVSVFSLTKSRVFFIEKILSASLNFGQNLLFFSRSQYRLFRLLELPKPFVRPPLISFRVTWQRFFFIFILTESLKNHIKSQKNYKIETSILLDSTWVDLHSEYII